MIPIAVDPDKVAIHLVGSGPAIDRREKLLVEGGAKPQSWASDLSDADAAGLTGLVYIAGVPSDQASAIAALAAKNGALVNVEDETDACAFQSMALLRRGDLTLAVGTGGKSPRLARRIRLWLADQFPESWAARLDELASLRSDAKAEGKSFQDVADLSDDLIDSKGWLG